MDEVIVRCQVVREDRVFGRLLDLLLTGVQRKGAEVVGLSGADLELYLSRLLAFVLQDAVSGAEEGMGIKTLGNRK